MTSTISVYPRVQRLVPTLTLLSLFIQGAGADNGRISFLEPENALWVRGFSRGTPATLDHFLEADRSNHWDKIEYEPGTDTFTVRASLWIGGVSTWRPTYMQIGRPGHESEAVKVQGDVWIRPPRRSLKRPDGRVGLINRLTLGDPDDADVRATLVTDGGHVFIGRRDAEFGITRGGELFAFNSVITAAAEDDELPDPGMTWKTDFRPAWYAAWIELVDTKISNIGGCVAYGMRADAYRIEGCHFDRCRYVTRQGRQKLVDCRFSNTEVAPVTGEFIEFIRCEFNDNNINWRIQDHRGIGVELVNCRIGPPKQPFTLRKNRYDPKRLLSRGVPVYPLCVERRSCVVKVVDMAGNPVAGAAVSVSCANDTYADRRHLQAVRNPLAITGADGMTPVRLEQGALLPAIRRQQATDDPHAPEVHDLKYILRVEKTGYQRLRMPLIVEDMQEVKTVRIQRARIKQGRPE